MWQGLDADGVARVAEAIRRTAVELRRTLPAPRGAPFYALDLAPLDTAILDRLLAAGMFRKYVRVLAVDCGWGGALHWWHERTGGSAVGLERAPALAAAARRLAGGRAALQFIAGRAHELPLRGRRFTHVWILDLSAREFDAPSTLAEAARVLRRGGEVGVVAAPTALASWRAALPAAGFAAPAVAAIPAEPVAGDLRIARQALLRRLMQDPSIGAGPVILQAARRYAAADRTAEAVVLQARLADGE